MGLLGVWMASDMRQLNDGAITRHLVCRSCTSVSLARRHQFSALSPAGSASTGSARRVRCAARAMRNPRGFTTRMSAGDGVHDEFRGVADEEALQPRARHHAHRDDGAALALGGARDRIVRPALAPGGSGCASRRIHRPAVPACAAPRARFRRVRADVDQRPVGHGRHHRQRRHEPHAAHAVRRAAHAPAARRRAGSAGRDSLGLANACEGSMAASTRGR